MPKRKHTFKTYWAATKNTARNSAGILAALIFSLPPFPAQAQQLNLDGVLAARKAALASLHVHGVSTIEVFGAMGGGDIIGSFHRWQSAGNVREDDEIASHSVRTLRLGDREYVINESGDVRELRGVLARHQRGQDFVADGEFVSAPQYDTFKGKQTLEDGRSTYAIEVNPPQAQPETVYLDDRSFMIDRVSYEEDDGIATEDYYDYGVFHGALIPSREVDSNGDREYDVTHYTRHVVVGGRIDPSVFTLPPSTAIQTDKPVTVPVRESLGHLYTQVHVGTKDYTFLIDTGAQMIALDSHVAAEQHIPYQGHLEVAGAKRVGGLGFAPLPSIEIGSAVLPVHSVSVLDLRGATGGADGVLGYPFFASAEVTIDPLSRSMTLGKPGTLVAQGTEFDIDNDRQLVEMHGTVNRVDGTFVVDTGNSTEVLLYSPFMEAHPYVVPLEDRQHPVSDFGVGGSARAAFAYIDELEFGPFHFYNRYASIMMSDRGAFADRFDAGNIGMGVLKNFVLTFDEANARIYVEKSAAFDDGRDRRRTEDPGVMFR